MYKPGITLVLIGSELTSGKRQDKHFAKMIEILRTRDLEPDECVIVGDDPGRLTAALRRVMAAGDLAFSFGGIGATPDDMTRQCAADAAQVPLIRHPEARAIMEERFGADAYPRRILMADLPEGSELIPNPVNQIPGFSVGDVHFVPGFPQMAWPMVEWVLEHRYPDLRGVRLTEQRVIVRDVKEGDIGQMLSDLASAYPMVHVSSLPHMENAAGREGNWIELGVKGIPEQTCRAFLDLVNALNGMGLSVERLDDECAVPDS